MVRKLCLIGMIIMLFFTGCVSVDIIDKDELYTRNDVEFMKESSSFGKGRLDDVYVALDYVYSDKTIAEKHGSSFEITSDDICTILSEGESFFFSFVYKGVAEFTFSIDETVYQVCLSKGYFSKWKIDSCEEI
ncbi:MAG: hypothetical protein E7388_01130 [Ruminococcaceae bacterium]|nr:hypothetical protein [Oscillospiraceae bacterium]